MATDGADRLFRTCLGRTVVGVEDAVLSRLEEMLDLKGDDEHLEVEAKLGLFSFRSEPPAKALSECVIEQAMCKNFGAQVSKEAFLRIQKVLDDASEGYGGSQPTESLQVRKRTVTTTRDDFYKPAQGSENVRVSTDSVTGNTVSIVQKSRLGDINVHAATQPDSLDFRISLNRELPATMPHGRPKYFRKKRRTEYEFDGWVIDLTEVYPQKKLEPQFEVEIELITSVLWDKWENPDRRVYLKDFLHSVRTLAHAAVEYTDDVFLPALLALPSSQQAKLCGVKRAREIPEVYGDAYTAEVGTVIPMVGHFLQVAVEEKKLKPSPKDLG